MHSLRRHLVDHVSVRKKRTFWIPGTFLVVDPAFSPTKPPPMHLPLAYTVYTSILVTPLPLRQPHQTLNNPIQGRTKTK